MNQPTDAPPPSGREALSDKELETLAGYAHSMVYCECETEDGGKLGPDDEHDDDCQAPFWRKVATAAEQARRASRAAWQPIETAPEATYVLVLVPNYGYCVASRTSDPSFPLAGERARFWFARGENDRIHPTHWMPLPLPPAPLAPTSPEER